MALLRRDRQIPHPSKHEEAAAKYVIETAKKFCLECAQDKTGNVVVRKPASPGYENRPWTCLQGHLDMVPEKRPTKKHDFLKDPITLVRKGNAMMADDTTLGADNGVAVATNLAIMADKSLVHGPLEFLFTVDEETGLTGARELDPTLLQSRTLLNLDSEEEGALYVGCSGGRDTTGTWKLETEAAPAGTVGVAAALVDLEARVPAARPPTFISIATVPAGAASVSSFQVPVVSRPPEQPT